MDEDEDVETLAADVDTAAANGATSILLSSTDLPKFEISRATKSILVQSSVGYTKNMVDEVHIITVVQSSIFNGKKFTAPEQEEHKN